MKHWLFVHCTHFGRSTLQLADDKRGVTMLEYGLIAALLAAVCVGAITTLGTTLNVGLNAVATSI